MSFEEDLVRKKDLGRLQGTSRSATEQNSPKVPVTLFYNWLQILGGLGGCQLPYQRKIFPGGLECRSSKRIFDFSTELIK